MPPLLGTADDLGLGKLFQFSLRCSQSYAGSPDNLTQVKSIIGVAVKQRQHCPASLAEQSS